MVQRPNEMPDYTVLLQRGDGFTASGRECGLHPSVQNEIYTWGESEGLEGRDGFPLPSPLEPGCWPLLEVAFCSADCAPMPLVLLLMRLLACRQTRIISSVILL
jgi:hypothetical protein